MIPLSLEEVAALAPGELDAAPWAGEISGIEIDSRRISDGELFVAVGAGADFCKHAFARGAAATLLPDDAFAALAALGKAVRDRSSARVVGITGSLGKTTTKDILAALCRPHVRTVAAEAGYNNELGLPLTLARIEHDTELVITEMAMRGLGQIRRLCELARPQIGVITSIGPIHLELLGTVDRIAQAKAELLEALPPGAVAIIPRSPELEPYVPPSLDVRYIGPGDSSVDAFERLDDGCRIRFDLRGEQVEAEFSFTVRHHATNALAAMLALEALGLPFPTERVEVAFSRWRGEETPLPGGGLLINDAWNANPVSMRGALDHLVERAAGRRKVAVLGEMAELGSYSDEAHREVARAVEEAGVDVLIAVGPRARAYGGRWVADAAEAVEALREELRPGDCVLVKGARALGLEAVAEALVAVTA